MAISIDDIDDDYGFEENQVTPPQSSEEIPEDNNGEETGSQKEPQEDAITSFLKSKGIEDPQKIKFENEDGTIEELDWNNLTPEEQLNILNTSNDNGDDNDLDDSEIDFINMLRTNGLTPSEYVAMIKQQGAAEYAKSLEESPKYQIDDLTDDELYVLDLQSRIQDLTPEEAQSALEKAKSDESLFAKQVQGIRAEYKRIEDDNNQRLTAQQQQDRQQQFQEFQNSVLTEIQNFTNLGNLDLGMTVDDMNDVANFILSEDGAGVNYFSKALNDPKQLVRMAWFATKGEEAIESITDYFTKEIQKVSREQYAKGVEDGKSGKSTSKRIVKTQVKPNNNQRQTLSVDDLD